MHKLVILDKYRQYVCSINYHIIPNQNDIIQTNDGIFDVKLRIIPEDGDGEFILICEPLDHLK